MVVSKVVSFGFGLVFALASYQSPGQSSGSSLPRLDVVEAVLENTAPSFTVDQVSRLEDAFGIEGRDAAMERLNELFSDVYTSFKPHERRSEREARDFFTTVDSLFDKHGLRNTDGPFLNEKLSSPYDGIACFHRSLVFNSLGKAYPFSIRPVIASDDHIFVRYESEELDTVINWETTSGKSLPDSHYIEKYGLSAHSLESGSYLRSLPDSQALAPLYRYFGDALEDSDASIEEILAFKRKAYRLDTTRLASLYSLAMTSAQGARYDSAYAYLDKALELDTANARTWFLRGLVAEKEHDPETASCFYDTALDIDSAHVKSLYRQATLSLERGDQDTFQESLKQLKSDKTENIFYIYNLEKKYEKQQQ
ncbi:MAG: tetratricopeptide repeat protein [Candidatus Woesearchaeota archaeon]